MDSLPMRAADDSPGATANSVKSDDSSPCHDPGRGSPPPNCAICLGTCRNKSFTDSCLHQFCFKCLLTWSKVKAECPLCKQNFKSIIHNVRSNHQYEEYMVEQRHTEELSERIDIDNLTTTRRFRYRTTLTLPRQNSLALQQLLLHHYPMVAELFPGPPAPRRRSPASFRRTVYRYNLWARPLPDFTHRFRDCSPDFYRHNTSQMHRLVPWLNRELHYLLNENVGHIAYVVARILELLPQHSINSTEFRDAMRRYFGENTEHFLHELYCFASTPYDMNGYDRHVQYTTDSTISTVVNSVVSSSESDASADSDIVVVSSSAPAPAPREPPAGPSRPLRAAPAYPQSYITQPADGVIPIETVSHSDTDDDSSEVMVVGYIKPPQDRTPEVVDLLGSDSDVFVQEPPEPSDPPSLVKLTLARRDAAASASDGGRTPSRSPPPRRARRPAPSPASTASAASAASAATAASRSASSDFPYRSSPSDSEEDADSRARRPERRRKKAKKRARKLAPREKESIASPAKRTKYKSYSGKGVKSSKKCAAGEDDAAPTETESGRPLDQPGTSGMSRDRSCLTIGVHGIGRGSGMPRRRERSRGSSDLCGPSGTSRVPCTCTGGISGGTSDISRGTSDESRGTSDISRFTSETSRDKSNYLTNGANVSVPGTSGIPRGRSERSCGSTDVLCGPSGISHVASDTSHSTGGVSRGTSDESRAASEVSWGTSDVSRGTSGTSRSTSEISQSTSEMSRGTRDLSRGKSEMTRGTSKVSRGKSEVSRGTRETSRGTSDVSSGTSEISRGTSHVSSGTSEISRGTSTSCGTKRKLERGTRRHESRRESKRLKSVVNVVNSQNNSAREPAGGRQSSELESESEYEPPASAGARSDSDDDLPLNLSLMKRSR